MWSMSCVYRKPLFYCSEYVTLFLLLFTLEISKLTFCMLINSDGCCALKHHEDVGLLANFSCCCDDFFLIFSLFLPAQWNINMRFWETSCLRTANHLLDSCLAHFNWDGNWVQRCSLIELISVREWKQMKRIYSGVGKGVDGISNRNNVSCQKH